MNIKLPIDGEKLGIIIDSELIYDIFDQFKETIKLNKDAKPNKDLDIADRVFGSFVDAIRDSVLFTSRPLMPQDVKFVEACEKDIKLIEAPVKEKTNAKTPKKNKRNKVKED